MSRHILRVLVGTALGLAGVAVMLTIAVPAWAQTHVGQYAQADIEYGLRLYRSTCVTCHAESGAGAPGVNLAVATPRARTDGELTAVIRDGIDGTAMPPGEYTPAELTALVAYVRMMGELDASDVRIGEADRGETIVFGKGECTTCHRVGRTGPLGLAPELTSVGATRTAGALEAALLDPSGAMIPINRPIRAVLADGTTFTGRRLNEDTYTVQIIDEGGRLRSLEKSGLRELTIETTSSMPSYAETLTTQEIADVVAFLLTLRGVEGLD